MKPYQKRKHLDNSYSIKSAKVSRELETVVEVPASGQIAQETSSFSEDLTDYSASTRPRLDEDAELNLQESALQCSDKAVALTHAQNVGKVSPASDALIFISAQEDLTLGAVVEIQTSGKTQKENCLFSENVMGDSSTSTCPCLDEDELETVVEVPASGQIAQETSSFSEDLTDYSASTRPRLDEDVTSHRYRSRKRHLTDYEPSLDIRAQGKKILQTPVSQDLEQSEIPPLCLPAAFPFHSVDKNKPFMSSVCGTDEKVMTIYYMPVYRRNGVSVLWDTQEGLVRPSKKIKMKEMTYIEKVHKNVPLSHMSQKRHLTDYEPSLDIRAQGKRKKADSLAGPPALEDCPRAKTPEWLVSPDHGFECMACCRVFPSLEILQEHVEYGVTEGFSCHVFHLAMARLNHKKQKEKNKKPRRHLVDVRMMNILA